MPRLLVLLSVLGLLGVGSPAELWAGPRAPVSPPSGTVLPGEYEPAERLLIAWDDSLARFLLDIMSAAWDEVPITVLLAPDQSDEGLDFVLRGLGLDPQAIQRVRVPMGSVWIRDFGPMVVRAAGGKRQIVDFGYLLDADEDGLPGALGSALWPHWSVQRSPLELEGGNVQSDGRGRCVTTAGYAEELDAVATAEPRLHAELRDRLGCQTIAVVPPLHGEPTGHVDMFATVTGPGQIIVGRYDPAIDPENAVRLDRTAIILRRAGFLVRRLPMPDHGDGVFRSYTNSLAINGVVIVPVYPEAAAGEDEAFEVFRAAYPGRRIVPVVASDIITLYGAVHCAALTIAAPPGQRSRGSQNRQPVTAQPALRQPAPRQPAPAHPAAPGIWAAGGTARPWQPSIDR
jgi:agmatine deiminase